MSHEPLTAFFFFLTGFEEATLYKRGAYRIYIRKRTGEERQRDRFFSCSLLHSRNGNDLLIMILHVAYIQFFGGVSMYMYVCVRACVTSGFIVYCLRYGYKIYPVSDKTLAHAETEALEEGLPILSYACPFFPP